MEVRSAEARKAALERYEILDTERDVAFDDIVQIACSILQVPFGIINLLDVYRQWFLSEVGLGVREMPLDGSFCAATIEQTEMLVIDDTRADPAWVNNCRVQGESGIRFYIGAPLTTPEGVRIGAICGFDTQPRTVTGQQQEALKALSRQVIALLELRLLNRQMIAKERELEQARGRMEVADRERQELQERLNALAEHSCDFIGMCDMEGNVFYGNPAALATVGIDSLDDFKRVPLLDFFYPEDRDMIANVFVPKVLEAGRADVDVRFRHFGTGKPIWMNYEVFVLRNADKQPIGLATVSRDVTQQRLADAALVESAKLAAVGRLASSIAHEINNPLEAVTNLLYIIAQDPQLSPCTRDYLDTAEREVARASQLTSQTLRFHRQSTAPTRTRPKFLFAEVLNLFHSRLQDRHIEVIQDYGDDTWLTCFEGDVRQVLNNMVSNGIDAMPAGGKLTIRTRKVMRWSDGVPGVRVTVADTGTGIAPALLPKIFEAFYSTKGIGGTGLGLWISCRIVHKHRGFIRAYSSTRLPNRGTTVMLWLPMTLADTASEPWQTPLYSTGGET